MSQFQLIFGRLYSITHVFLLVDSKEQSSSSLSANDRTSPTSFHGNGYESRSDASCLVARRYPWDVGKLVDRLVVEIVAESRIKTGVVHPIQSYVVGTVGSTPCNGLPGIGIHVNYHMRSVSHLHLHMQWPRRQKAWKSVFSRIIPLSLHHSPKKDIKIWQPQVLPPSSS